MSYLQLNLKSDRATLADLGLKMPRCTPKYLATVSTLSAHWGVSYYFIHIQAARWGTASIYREAAALGYTWTGERWTSSQQSKDHKKLVNPWVR